jgi:NAD(P)-dependent dehydrogenase (short-subunit alcohol dehydrogenase family)
MSQGLDQYGGKLALVTGAADGIGRMLAQGLTDAGMKVCVADIRKDGAQVAADEIGCGAFALSFDVSDRAACFSAAEQLAEQGAALNLLWINAGVGVGAPLIKGKPHTVEWAFGVNVLGAIWTAQAFRPLMEEASGPRHVGVTASSASLIPPEGDFPLYATTKHGTFAVAEALRGELAADGIGTTILCPGLLNTDIWDAARARPDRFGGERRMDPAISGPWREAKSPDVMWPHIERTIAAGGGYLTCATEPETLARFRARADAIAAGIVEM